MKAAPPNAAQQRELWQRAFAGDRAAADSLAVSVVPWVQAKAFAYARTFGADTVDADDLFAVGFSKFTVAVQSYDGSGTFRGWFFTLAAREMVRHCRKVVAAADRMPLEDLPDALGQAVAPPNLSTEVTLALDRLAPIERDVLRHREGYGTKTLSAMATARKLKVNVRVVETVHRRAMNKLSDQLIHLMQG